MRHLFFIVIISMILSGCHSQDAEVYETEKGTYFVDKSGDLYQLNGKLRTAVEKDTAQSRVKKYSGDLLYSREHPVKWDVKFKYVSGKLYYKFFLEDIRTTDDYIYLTTDEKEFIEALDDIDDLTQSRWYNILLNNSSYNTLLTLKLGDADYFVFDKIDLSNDWVIVKNEGKVTQISYEGSIIYSPEKFNLIGDMTVSNRL